MAASQEVELQKLIVRISGEARHYEKFLKKAEEDIKKTLATVKKEADNTTRAVGESFVSVGKKMTMFVTGPLAAVGAVGVKSFSDFNEAMTKSTSIMSGVTDDLRKNMENVAKGISKESITAPKALAESYFFLASAGLSAEQSMGALAAVEKFAVAGAFDMALATDLLTDSQMALGLASKDTEENLENLIKVSDALALANIQSNASMQQFAEALTADAAISARQFGMELETTMAVLNSYAAQGKKGAEAGNMLGRATRLLKAAFADNTKVFEKMNIEVVNSEGNYANIIDIVADMETAFDGMSDSVRSASLDQLGFAALAQKSILPLIGLSDQMKIWEAEQRLAGGTTERIANKQMKAFINQLKIVKNQITIAAGAIGEILAPAILTLAKIVGGLVSWFNDMGKATKFVIVSFGVLVGAVGPALLIFGKFILVVDLLTTAIKANAVVTALSTIKITSWTTAVAVGDLVALGFTKTLAGIKAAFLAIQALSLVQALVLGPVAAAIGLYIWYKNAVGEVEEAQARLLEVTKKSAAATVAAASKQLIAIKAIADPKERIKGLEEYSAFAEKVENAQFDRMNALIDLYNDLVKAQASEKDTLEAQNAAQVAQEEWKGSLMVLKDINGELDKQIVLQRQIAGGVVSEGDVTKTKQANLIAAAQKLQILFQKQADTAKLTSDELKIQELASEGLNSVTLKLTQSKLALKEASILSAEGLKMLKEYSDELDFQLKTVGKTTDEIERMKLAEKNVGVVGLEAIKVKQELLNIANEEQKVKDDAIEAEKTLAKDVETLTKNLDMQAKTYKMTSEQAQIFTLETRGATDEMLSQARAIASTIADQRKKTEAERDHNKEMERGRRIIEKNMTPLQKFHRERDKLQKTFEAGGLGDPKSQEALDEFSKEVDNLRDKFDEEMKLKFKTEGADVVRADSAKAMNAWQKWFKSKRETEDKDIQTIRRANAEKLKIQAQGRQDRLKAGLTEKKDESALAIMDAMVDEAFRVSHLTDKTTKDVKDASDISAKEAIKGADLATIDAIVDEAFRASDLADKTTKDVNGLRTPQMISPIPMEVKEDGTTAQKEDKTNQERIVELLEQILEATESQEGVKLPFASLV